MTTANDHNKPSRIVSRGWCRGTHAKLADGTRANRITDLGVARLDLIGALNLARFRSYPVPFDAVRKLAAVADTESLTEWNDAPNRVQTQVVDLLESVGL